MNRGEIGMIGTEGSRSGLTLITIVDNSGVTRVKAVPSYNLAQVAETGVGLSDVFAVMAVDDGVASSPGYETPSGDMRMIPDLDAAVDLYQSNLQWAPATMVDQELAPRPNCGRTILKRTVERVGAMGLTAQLAFESEFSLTVRETDQPLNQGPGYSVLAFLTAEQFSLDLVNACEAQGLGVQQFHPEYSAGQFEVSIRHRDPLFAADAVVLFRVTAHRIAALHGLRVSFGPRPHPAIEVGNGCHLHLSLWRGEENLFAGGTGMGPDGLSAVAGVLGHLLGIQAVLTPSVPSYERITPHHWAAAYTCWGPENREAAIRAVEGTVSNRPGSANIELKPVDASANPYLAIAVVLEAALDGIEQGLTPPGPVSVDPDSISPSEREKLGIKRLPANLVAAVAAMDADGLVRRVFGEAQYGAFRAVRLYESDTFASMERDDQIQAHRWRY